MLRYLVFLFLFAFFYSCQNCMCLPSDGLRLGMVSFDSADIDTIILRRFEKGRNFNHIIDSLEWNKTNVIFRAQGDTFQMGAFSGDILLKSKFDYEVFIPGLSRTLKITQMNEPQADGNCDGKTMCINRIVSCKLDDGTTPIQINDDILYLKK